MPEFAGWAEGRRVGPYELVRCLGTGGMGEVWQADLHGPGGFCKPVALKCLSARVHDPSLHQVLLREARLGARLHHPNVVGTLAVSEHEGTWVVALELVQGASTLELLKAEGALPAAVVIDIGIQAAAGLAHAHDNALVHRDVKPANLLVDRLGLVKVADLGVSVLARDEGTSIAGTYGYMAPEQALAHAEPRSDLFSLAVTLYVLATARRPFGQGVHALRAIAHVESRLKDSSFIAPVEEAVQGLGPILARCLRSKPADRYSDARELARALEALREEHLGEESLLTLLARVRPDLVVQSTRTPDSSAPTRVVPTGNLPAPRDPFVGRVDERRDLHSLVMSHDHRFLVLHGPGGMGKTRLALQVARQVQRELRGGAWAFDLSGARTAEQICAAVAQGFGVEPTFDDPVAQLGRLIRAKGRALIVVDNLEQCVDALPSTLARWIDLAPQATFLGTTRTRPRLHGEHAVAVGPLRPDEAIELFEARSGRPLDDAERAQVGPLCAELEAMPLAIELAAARVRLLGVAGVREHLSLALLSGGSRDLPERHRSVTASLQWSVQLLTKGARRGLAELSVFESTFALHAAEVVLDLPGVFDTMLVLEELIDASLLRVDPHTNRFSMLSAVRQFGCETAPVEVRRAAGARHAAHFAQFGSPDALRVLWGRGGPEHLATLRLELDNVATACLGACEAHDPPTALAALRACWAVMKLQGPLDRAALLAERVVEIATGSERAEATFISGMLHLTVGRSDIAHARLDGALRAYRELGDRHHEGEVLGALGALAVREGDAGRAQELLQQGLGVLPSGSRREWAQLTGELANIDHRQGRSEQARSRFEAVLAVNRQTADRRGEGIALGNLANVEGGVGNVHEACAHYEAALQVHRAMGDRRSEADVLSHLGTQLLELGKGDEARANLHAALAIHQEVGSRRSEAATLSALGSVYGEHGQLEQAQANFEAALVVHTEVHDTSGVAVVLANLGMVAVQRDQLDLALERFLEALVVLEELGDRRTVGVALHNIGLVYRDRGQPDQAAENLSASVRVNRETGNRRLEASSLAELACMHSDPTHALGLLDEAEAIMREVADPARLGMILLARAEVQWRQGDTDASLASIEAAERTAPPDNHLFQLRLQRVQERITESG